MGGLLLIGAGGQCAEPARPAVSDSGVFRTVLRKRGDDGVSCYRIPGLATSTNGTLLAVFDIRHDNCGDLPANIDVGLMRSTDDGATWSPMRRIMDFDAGEPGSLGNGVGDPCILVDRRTGAIFVVALWSKGDRGWRGSGPGLSPEETGQFMLVRSTDDGLTWSAPINITAQVKRPEWRLCFQGPGAGIQLRDGTLVFPAQFKDASNRAHAFFIFSQDGGITWQGSAGLDGEGMPDTTEAQVADLNDGSMLITLRNHAGNGLRAWSRWKWSGELARGSWSPLTFACEDPVCQASLLRADAGTLVFANPASATRRRDFSLRFSRDEGKTWSAPRVLDSRPAAYSSMTLLRDGSIGVLYECGDATAADTLTFARIPLNWLLEPRREARLRPAPVFGNHMVFQRDTPLPVWGEAEPGATVEVRFAGKLPATQANAAGHWSATLPAFAASRDSRMLEIVSTTTDGIRAQLHYTNVVVGEVWIAAGQSNLEWPLQREAFATQALAQAKQPDLRLLNLDFVAKHGFGKPFTSEQAGRLQPDTYFTGQWLPSSPEAAKPFSAIGYYFGSELRRELGVPVGVIHLAVGGSPTEAWIRRGALAANASLRVMVSGNWLTNESLGPWCRERGHQNLDALLREGRAVPADDLGPNHPFKPGFLWAAGGDRLAPFALRGVIWYQGESNAQEDWRVRQHEQLFPLLVTDWRKQWRRGDFPFLFCQLSSIGTEQGYQAGHWPDFRDSQRRLLERLPNLAMAVTSDLGHPTDVHPRNKRDVGYRVALAALGKVYGRSNEISGPLFATARRRASEVAVSFRHAAGLRTRDGQPPGGFGVAGADGVFRPVMARIENDQVLLDCAAIALPVRVRYGWMPFPRPPLNLCNAAELPASTFQGTIESQ